MLFIASDSKYDSLFNGYIVLTTFSYCWTSFFFIPDLRNGIYDNTKYIIIHTLNQRVVRFFSFVNLYYLSFYMVCHFIHKYFNNAPHLLWSSAMFLNKKTTAYTIAAVCCCSWQVTIKRTILYLNDLLCL